MRGLTASRVRASKRLIDRQQHMQRPDSRQHDEKDELAIIQQTDVDAKVAKRSAAAFGYLNDPFIEEFVKSVDRKPPIINRG
jgi:hypothetical protein